MKRYLHEESAGHGRRGTKPKPDIELLQTTHERRQSTDENAGKPPPRTGQPLRGAITIPKEAFDGGPSGLWSAVDRLA